MILLHEKTALAKLSKGPTTTYIRAMLTSSRFLERVKGYFLEENTKKLMRGLLLVFAAYWVIFPYFTGVFFGDRDENYYHNLLADSLYQYRAGYFPVYLTQTEFVFGGIPSPVRSPYLYLLGGLIDLLTGRTLRPAAILHIELIFSVLLSVVICYSALKSFNKKLKWEACLLSAFFIMCPGVIGVMYIRDMVNSVLATPFAVMLFVGLVRSAKKEDFFSAVIMGTALSLLWASHPAIALLTMSLVGIAQLCIFLLIRRNKKTFALYVLSYLIFGLLSLWIFIPIFQLNADTMGPSTANPLFSFMPKYVVEFAVSMTNLQWPWAIRPIDFATSYEGSIQLGYCLWAMFALTLYFVWKTRDRLGLILSGICFVLIVLLYPIRTLHHWAWAHLPNAYSLINTSSPHLRIYIAFASIATLTGFFALEYIQTRAPQKIRNVLLTFMFFGYVWSAYQFSYLTALAVNRQGSTDEERDLKVERTTTILKPENSHNFPLMPGLPEEHTDTIFYNSLVLFDSTMLMNPREELLKKCQQVGIDPRIQSTLNPSKSSIKLMFERLGTTASLVKFTIPPGKKIIFGFDSEYVNLTPPLSLDITGRHFYRKHYPDIIGSLRPPGHFSFFLLEHFDSQAKEISFDMFDFCKVPTKECYLKVSNICATEFEPSDVPIQVLSQLPYRAEVDLSSKDALKRYSDKGQILLETNRLYFPDYDVKVNGKAVIGMEPGKNDSRLRLRVPVPAGIKSKVELTYKGTFGMKVAFIVSALTWLVVFLTSLKWLFKRNLSFACKRS